MSVISPTVAPPNVKKVGVALYPSDIQDVERIRDHFELESFSQALRRVIKIAVRTVDADAAKTEAA